MKEGEKLDKIDKNDPPYGLPENGEGMRNIMIPRKFEPEMPAFETKKSQSSATNVAKPDPTNIALHADHQGNRHGHNSHLPSWKSHLGMEGERHMGLAKNANVLEKDGMLGKYRKGEDTSELSTSEKWIADCQKRKVGADNNWAAKKIKTEQRISFCVDKLKETVSSFEDISAKTKSVIELKELELLKVCLGKTGRCT